METQTGFLAPDSHIWNVLSTLFLEIDGTLGRTQSRQQDYFEVSFVFLFGASNMEMMSI